MPLVLAVAVLLLYARTASFQFTNWDDRTFIVENPALTEINARSVRMILKPGGIPEERLYIPITYLLYFIEAIVGGVNPVLFHMTNVVLHLLNVILTFYLVRGWTRRPAAALAAAMLFAVHPLQVEAVAWVMGRKELLATLFAFATLILHQRARGARQFGWRIAALAATTAAVLAKPTMVILPFLLLLADYYRHGTLKRSNWTATLPYLLPVIAAVVVNLQTANVAGAPGSNAALWHVVYLPSVICGWLSRFLLMSPPRLHYSLAEALAVERLAPIYVVFVLLILGILVIAMRLKRREIWFGVLFCAVAMVPALTIVLELNREFITADRYGYFPLLGICFVLATVPGMLPDRLRRPAYAVLWIFTAAAACLAVQRVSVWRNSATLWSSVLAADPHNHIAWNSLGNHYRETGNPHRALEHYARALRLRPDYAIAWFNKGATYAGFNQPQEALRHYAHAARLKPNFTDAHFNLAVIHMQNERLEPALNGFQQVIRIDPQNSEALYQAGVVLQKLDRFEDAASLYARLVAVDPGNLDGYFKLGLMQHRLGRLDGAVSSYSRVITLEPENAMAHHNLGMAYLAQGRAGKCVRQLERAAGIDPADAETACQLGQAYTTTGEFASAIKWLERALALDPRMKIIHGYLAIAHENAGNAELARKHLEQARQFGIGEEGEGTGRERK